MASAGTHHRTLPRQTNKPRSARDLSLSLVALNVFTTDVGNHRDVNETRREVLGSNFPTSTMVQVVALARPELLLEINAIAVIS